MSFEKTPTRSKKSRSSSKRLCEAFKSPFQADRTSPSLQPCDLKTKLQKIEAEIQTLKQKGFREDELQVHIDKLHEYNEVKDAGQMVLGRLATLAGVRTQDMYVRYGLEMDD
ncbi:hypothetical protein ScPMuIL_010372 [Solemya velum]